MLIFFAHQMRFSYSLQSRVRALANDLCATEADKTGFLFCRRGCQKEMETNEGGGVVAEKWGQARSDFKKRQRGGLPL